MTDVERYEALVRDVYAKMVLREDIRMGYAKPSNEEPGVAYNSLTAEIEAGWDKIAEQAVTSRCGRCLSFRSEHADDFCLFSSVKFIPATAPDAEGMKELRRKFLGLLIEQGDDAFLENDKKTRR